ncbi:MAG: hypothetical protein LBK99_13600 [Opitutaceae bacterium]|jgi:hypothetical protein|nr:hypothetical protein [Opitutaceae bacterium]
MIQLLVNISGILALIFVGLIVLLFALAGFCDFTAFVRKRQKLKPCIACAELLDEDGLVVAVITLRQDGQILIRGGTDAAKRVRLKSVR